MEKSYRAWKLTEAPAVRVKKGNPPKVTAPLSAARTPLATWSVSW